MSANAFTLLRNGGEYFPALKRAFDAAQRVVQLESYIFEDDAQTQPVLDALKAAAQRGVKVRVLIDGIGSKTFIRQGGLEALRTAGVEARVFNRDDNPFLLARSRLRRLHRKVIVVDETCAFVGGINIVSDFAPPNPPTAPQYDYAVQITGPLVNTIYRSSLDVFASAETSLYLRRNLKKALKNLPTITESAGAAFVYRDNFRNRRSIERMMTRAIASAKHEVVLANAYFLPGWRFRQSLKRAAKRGVKVTLLLQGFTDHAYLRAATRFLYHSLLDAGVYIAEYERSMLHAKVCVIDGTWCTVGSSNLDPFSLLLAREANVVIKEHAFVQTLRASIGDELNHNAASIAPTMWRRRSVVEKMKSAMAYGLAKVGLAVIGLGGA
jgi:cardiolipin synthase A/B